jgi:hypothetical protein
VAEAPPRRVAALVGLWAAVVSGAALFSGCYGHICDGDVQVYGRNAGEGRLLSADLWESGPINGTWLAFPKQRAWIFDLTSLGSDRLPQVIVPYVSADSDGSSYTIAAGNLAEQSQVANGRVVIKNGTCADYYLRVVVEAAPRPPLAAAATPADAGAEAGP